MRKGTLMKKVTLWSLLLFALLALAGFTGCESVRLRGGGVTVEAKSDDSDGSNYDGPDKKDKKGGPPDHAPAHGHRKKKK